MRELSSSDIVAPMRRYHNVMQFVELNMYFIR